MADPTLELTLTYQPGLDESYAERERDIAWRAALLDEEMAGVSAEPGGGALPKPEEKPSAIATGAQAAFQAAGEGARGAMEGLTRTILTRPQGGENLADEVARGLADKAGGVRQFLMEGLLQVVSAPLIGLGAGARQALKNQRPDLEQAVIFPDGGFVRMMLGQGNPLQGDEQAAALRGPMTVGEALDFAVQAAPMALGAVSKVAQAAKIQAPTLTGEAGALRPKKIAAEHVGAADVFRYDEVPDPEFYYHITPRSTVKRILSQGLKAGGKPTMAEGFYRDASKGKIHVTDREGVAYWRDRIQEHLEHEMDNPPPLDVVRIPRAAVRVTEDPKARGVGDKKSWIVEPEPGPGEIAKRAFTEERGAIGARPEEGGAGGAPPPNEPPRAGAPGESPTPEMRLNLERVDASARVKALMTDLNQQVGGERLAEHRQVISHGQTIAEGATLALDDILLADPARTSIEAGRAVQQGLRNYYNAVATRLERMTRTGAAPDDVLDTYALALFMAAQDERFGAGFARGLEARKIQSEAATPAGGGPRKAARGRSAEGGLTQDNVLWLGEQLGVDPAVLHEQLATARTAREARPPAPAATPQGLMERASALREAANIPADATLSIAELVAGKIGGEFTLTTVAAELIRTAHGGRMPERVPIGEVIAAKIAAEWQAQQPIPPSPEAVLAVYKAINRAEQAAEQAQAKAGDELAALIAGAKAGSGATPAKAPSVAEMIAGKLTAEQWAAEQAAQGAPVSPEALRAVTNALRKAQEAAEDAQARAGDDLAAIIASARVGAGQAARAAREASVAELVIANVRFQLEATRPSPEAILAALRALTRPQQRTWLANMWHSLRAGRDLFHETWINALLSNPVTHVSNLTGTGLSTLWEIPERVTAEMVNRLFFRDPAGVQRGETATMLRSTVGALEDGMRLANETWETGQAAFETGQVETRQVRARDYGFDPDSMLGRALDVFGAALRSKAAPTRALLTEDAFYKGVNFRMEISALALREGLREGKTGPALEQRVAALEARPTPEMIAAAEDAATLRTLNRELGPAGQAFMTWANEIPGGRVVLPFIRTPTNIAKWTVQRTPVLNMLSEQNWRDIQAGGAARDKAVARMALGSAVGAVIAYQVAQGNITGQGPSSRTQKRLAEITGARPSYSIKVGDEWVKYQRGGDPVAGLVGVIADFVELASEIPEQDALDEWAAHGEVLALALGQTFVNKTYMQGLANVLEAIKQPDRSSKQVVTGFARSLVPAGVRQFARVSDDHIVRDARTLVDAIKAGIPGLSQGIPPQRNPITGEPVQAPAGWGPDMLSPALITKRTDDAVIAEVLANKIDLATVPWYVGGTLPQEGGRITEARATEGLRLTPEEHDRWITLMTEDVKDGQGRTLHGALSALVASDKYQQQSTGPDGGRALLIKTIYQTFREAAKARLMDPATGSPLLKRDLESRMRKRLEQRLPMTDPRSPQFNPGALLKSLGR